MNKNNTKKKDINNKKLKNILYIVIFILILFIFYKYLFIEKFELTTITNYESTVQSNINNKCYIICKNNIYHYMEDYILSFYKKLNANILIFDDINDLPEINKIDTYIFIQTIPNESLNKIN